AASRDSGTWGSGGSTEEAFMTFYREVKQIEKRDSVLTSKNQTERLTRPGSSYFNLNPFEVLQIDPERFRQLSVLVHPDKNQDEADRAQKALEAVDKASKLLLDQEQENRALDVIQAGKEYVGRTEDDPEPFKQALCKQTMKLFAEREREARDIEAQGEAKRERVAENFEEGRDGRVDRWRNFQANTEGKKEKKNRTFLRPPKVKMSSRQAWGTLGSPSASGARFWVCSL
uniref:J domain-containing protein n=1 Tax=Saimiri boliviensis boliviensis TaxID=39432 RepID=A0A2K6TDC8_SAIBB